MSSARSNIWLFDVEVSDCKVAGERLASSSSSLFTKSHCESPIVKIARRRERKREIERGSGSSEVDFSEV